MAKCPICKTVELHLSHYDDDLPVSGCNNCGGSWLRANEYAIWLKTQAPGKYDLAAIPEASDRLPVNEPNQAALCPDCGHLLRKYRVGSNINFHLDRCNNCNGVWFDKHEWQILKTADLHDEINRMFTEPWQKQVQSETTADNFESLYISKFGKDDYEKIKEIRLWLQENPNRNILIAYLLDKDPYTV